MSSQNLRKCHQRVCSLEYGFKFFLNQMWQQVPGQNLSKSVTGIFSIWQRVSGLNLKKNLAARLCSQDYSDKIKESNLATSVCPECP